MARVTRANLGFRALRWVFRRLLFGYFRLEVRGLGHVPSSGGAIIAANHPSLLDGLLLLVAVERPVRFLVAEDMYTHPILNPLFRMMGCIPVYRTRAANGDALRAAVAALQAGELVGIFPEGTIHHHGAMRQLKRGVALLALRTGLPVVPLGFRGSREAFPDGARVPRPGRIAMTFGPPSVYAPVAAEHIPDARVTTTLEDIRREVVRCFKPQPAAAPEWGKALQVVVCSPVVLSISALLTATARPSLDPMRLEQLRATAQVTV